MTEEDLFAQQVRRLDEVSRSLRVAYRELAQCLIAEKQAKANIYNQAERASHAERQGMATANTASLSAEVLSLKGEIDALEVERSDLKFIIQHVGE